MPCESRPLILRTVETNLGLKLALFDTEGFLIDGQIDVTVDHPANNVSTVRVTFVMHPNGGVIQAPTVEGAVELNNETGEVAAMPAEAAEETGPGCGAAGFAQNSSQVCAPITEAAADAPTEPLPSEFTSEDAWDAATRARLWGLGGKG